MWSLTSLRVFCHTSQSSCSTNSKTMLRKHGPHLWRQQKSSSAKNTRFANQLGVNYLGSSQLEVSCSGRQRKEFVTQKEERNLSSQSQQHCLMLSSKGEANSLVLYQHQADRIRVNPDCTFTFEDVNQSSKTFETGYRGDNTEEPVLFSLGNNNYQQALSSITAAREAGSICQSAASRLKDLCHSLHMENVIRATAKPCSNSAEDIIVWKEGQELLSNFFTKKDNGGGEVSVKLKECVKYEPNTNDDKSPQNGFPDSNVHMEMSCSDLPSVSFESVDINELDINSHMLTCSGDQPVRQGSESPSEGPSKEQLVYIHHRLSEEMPRFFEQSHDYGLYADNINFDNRIMKLNTRGLPAYKATIQSLKYLSTAYLLKTEMEVLRITMEIEQGCVQARWRVKGIPLHSFIIRPFGRRQNFRYFDAFSTFCIGDDGLIHTHVLDKVVPSSENKVPAASWAVRLGIMLGLVRPPAYAPDVMKAAAFMRAFFGK